MESSWRGYEKLSGSMVILGFQIQCLLQIDKTMRKPFITLILFLLLVSAKAQFIYYESFSSGTFPAGWVPNDSRIMLLNNVPSSGYSSSPTSPPASGGYNVIFQHCAPTGSTITLTVSGVVNTSGKNNIRVGFGRRATAAWDREMAFEWSSDGTNWNLITNDASDGASTTWSSIYYDLPSDADNVPNLRFRFSFVTATNDNCTAPPNFRIDDFIVGANFSLPIELTKFTSELVHKNVHLSWSTASETNNAHFLVERGADGRVFAEIGRVAGAGTVRETREYAFIDERPLPGANFYRLRQVDFDGRFSFSPVRRVVVGQAAGAFLLYPSPASDFLQIQLAESADTDGAWEIFDAAGRQVMRGVLPAESAALPVFIGDLLPGAYYFRLVSGQNLKGHSFVKQ